jgi:hypothetical protein
MYAAGNNLRQTIATGPRHKDCPANMVISITGVPHCATAQEAFKSPFNSA